MATHNPFRNVKATMELEDKLTFGKHLGETFEYVAETDPDYIFWMHENIDKFNLSDEVLCLADSNL